MNFPIPRILFCIAATLIAVDAVCVIRGHFLVDLVGYAVPAVFSLLLFAGGLFYQLKRPDPGIVAMLFGTSFLCAFSAAASLLNYILLTVTGPRIDFLLAAIDRSAGFDWVQVMTVMSHHPALNKVLFFAYATTLPQIAILVIVLSLSGRHQEVYRFCLAVAVGAIVAIGIWATAPSLGAKSIYALPASMEHRMALHVTTDYGRALVALLHNGPGYITPKDVRGLIAFPSYHVVLAGLLIWYARNVVWLRWPVLILNLVVLISAPVQGGHHLIDIFGGVAVAIISVLLVRRTEAMKLPSLAAMAPGIPTFATPGMFKQMLSPVSIQPRPPGDAA
jgi:hypothetical protein